mgnify:CR=1 FL=1
MSYNNNVYKLEVGDLVERITWDAQAKKQGIIIALGSDLPYCDAGDSLVQILWQGEYGTFWAKPEKLKLIAKGKRNV